MEQALFAFQVFGKWCDDNNAALKTGALPTTAEFMEIASLHGEAVIALHTFFTRFRELVPDWNGYEPESGT